MDSAVSKSAPQAKILRFCARQNAIPSAKKSFPGRKSSKMFAPAARKNCTSRCKMQGLTFVLNTVQWLPNVA